MVSLGKEKHFSHLPSQKCQLTFGAFRVLNRIIFSLTVVIKYDNFLYDLDDNVL